MLHSRSALRHRRVVLILCAAILLSAMTGAVLAHPLGNFTVNHFAQIEVGADRVTIHYVLDMAEIPTFQEKQAIDVDGDGLTSTAELNTYLERATRQYARGILVDIDGLRLTLEAAAKNLSLPPGAGGLPTLRVECDFTGTIPSRTSGATHRLRFEDTNHQDRIGWREIVVKPAAGVAIFDSSAFGNSISDALRAYPADTLVAPLDERVAELSFTRGAPPAGAQALRTRDGRVTAQARDRLVELIGVPEVTPAVALLGLLLAAALGSLHALSPGHGKTVVGAYLVGTRGTARHAAFLGLTVTITHTIGVFALGLVTLYASHYIVPERLFPVLSLVSGGIVLAIGLSLFIHGYAPRSVHQGAIPPRATRRQAITHRAITCTTSMLIHTRIHRQVMCIMSIAMLSNLIHTVSPLKLRAGMRMAGGRTRICRRGLMTLVSPGAVCWRSAFRAGCCRAHRRSSFCCLQSRYIVLATV